MKRTNIKVRVEDGIRWITRTVFEDNDNHYIRADGRYLQIRENKKGILKVAMYGRVEYIIED